MSNEVELFGKMSEAYKELLGELESDDNLTGGDFGPSKRISIRGGVFRRVVNGKEIESFDSKCHYC